jgi:hypothetical protein
MWQLLIPISWYLFLIWLPRHHSLPPTCNVPHSSVSSAGFFSPNLLLLQCLRVQSWHLSTLYTHWHGGFTWSHGGLEICPHSHCCPLISFFNSWLAEPTVWSASHLDLWQSWTLWLPSFCLPWWRLHLPYAQMSCLHLLPSSHIPHSTHHESGRLNPSKIQFTSPPPLPQPCTRHTWLSSGYWNPLQIGQKGSSTVKSMVLKLEKLPLRGLESKFERISYK